jgi:hypothetical protein
MSLCQAHNEVWHIRRLYNLRITYSQLDFEFGTPSVRAIVHTKNSAIYLLLITLNPSHVMIGIVRQQRDAPTRVSGTDKIGYLDCRGIPTMEDPIIDDMA